MNLLWAALCGRSRRAVGVGLAPPARASNGRINLLAHPVLRLHQTGSERLRLYEGEANIAIQRTKQRHALADQNRDARGRDLVDQASPDKALDSHPAVYPGVLEALYFQRGDQPVRLAVEDFYFLPSFIWNFIDCGVVARNDHVFAGIQPPTTARTFSKVIRPKTMESVLSMKGLNP